MIGKNTSHNTNDISYRVINKTNIESFKNSVEHRSWSEILNENKDPEKAFNIFSESIIKAYEENFPVKIIKNSKKVNKNKSPWMTKCILKSVRKKKNYTSLF
jgi:iron uptake system EfeUOB component EfeO/EfeM